MDVIYLDHAASSWPKPPQVADAMVEAVREYGANPGRGSHAMAVRASRTLFNTRRALAKLFAINNPNDISFTLNTTMALNMGIKGFLKRGDHVICTAVEHNSVRRPLEYGKTADGIEVTYVQVDRTGLLRMDSLKEALQANTSLIVCTHSSNLLGSILPIADIVTWARSHGVRVLVDAAQSAGVLPIHVGEMGIDMLAFPGHKGLLGPQGTGGLYISPEIDLEPLLQGGTGSQSEAIEQPKVRPDRYESGTQNTPGIAGLGEGVRYVLNETVEKIHTIEWNLTQKLMYGLQDVPGLQILGPAPNIVRTGIVAFTLADAESAEISHVLDRDYGIAVRAGFHCTPMAHTCAGTQSTGAVRASLGCFTTESDVEALIHAVKEIEQRYRI
jgi:cysteine desulfurase family protein